MLVTSFLIEKNLVISNTTSNKKLINDKRSIKLLDAKRPINIEKPIVIYY